jgi:hypothetical protein
MIVDEFWSSVGQVYDSKQVLLNLNEKEKNNEETECRYFTGVG